tara:strand:- start:16454 stop:17242 length:789 start_codon:yes stop_codon:yes gene_type:complete
MFHALANGKIDTEDLDFVHELKDIETLNQAAMEEKYEVTAVSFHAYTYIAEKYAILPHGASFGDNYGPVIISSEPMRKEDLKNCRIAVPGLLTTAYLILKIYLEGTELTQRAIPFDEIMDNVKNGNVDAGVLIHEGQLTFEEEGFHLVEDLGKWWKKETGGPLPLGCNVIRKDLGKNKIKQISNLLKQSIIYSLENREEALDHAMQYARDLPREKADQFVGMYVNNWTREYNETSINAIRQILEKAYDLGIIPKKIKPEFTS